MTPEQKSARDLARRLVDRAGRQGDTSDESAGAVLAASEQAYRALAHSLGASGFNALLRRALTEAAFEHPVLKQVRPGRAPEPVLGDVGGLLAAHGAPVVSAALEAALNSTLFLLGRLIGHDMVARLAESAAQPTTRTTAEM